MITGHPVEPYETGRVVGAGSFICRLCGYRFALEGLDEVPDCPSCGGTRFDRASLFEAPEATEEQDTAERLAVGAATEPPDWLAAVRAELPGPGEYVAYADGGDVNVVELRPGWSRVGRSASADIRLDDPTVSRRHALIVRGGDGDVRVLDDRSLNGIEVNGEPVEWGSLADGDELTVGRYSLYLLAEPAGDRSRTPGVSA